MPRYFFNVRDGTSYPDNEGVELTGLTAARQEAIKLAGALMTEEPQTFWNGEEWHMEVTDETGLILFSFLFLATDAPSVSGIDRRVCRQVSAEGAAVASPSYYASTAVRRAALRGYLRHRDRYVITVCFRMSAGRLRDFALPLYREHANERRTTGRLFRRRVTKGALSWYRCRHRAKQ